MLLTLSSLHHEPSPYMPRSGLVSSPRLAIRDSTASTDVAGDIVPGLERISSMRCAPVREGRLDALRQASYRLLDRPVGLPRGIG